MFVALDRSLIVLMREGSRLSGHEALVTMQLILNTLQYYRSHYISTHFFTVGQSWHLGWRPQIHSNKRLVVRAQSN